MIPTTKPDTETWRDPLAIAWDEWLASNEGQEARAANTLPHNTNHYLENRLHRAFDAGAKAATVSPSDFEQLIQLRNSISDALSEIETMKSELKNDGRYDPYYSARIFTLDTLARRLKARDMKSEALAHTGGKS